MSEHRNRLKRFWDACMKDGSMKARLLDDPRSFLAEHGMPLPDGMELEVRERPLRFLWFIKVGRGLWITPRASRKFLVKHYGS